MRSGGIHILLQTVRTAKGEGRLVITGHDAPDVDSLACCMLMQSLFAHEGIAAEIVLPTPADGHSAHVMARYGMAAQALRGEIFPEDRLVLVDHHRLLHPGHVVACIDHHPTDYPPAYPYVQIEPAGACALLVLGLMQETGMAVREEHRRLVVTAMYLDTIALRSAKISTEEAAWARAQAEHLGMDIDWLMREGMGLCDMTRPAHELAMESRKDYVFGDRHVVSTYVQTDEMTPDRLEALLEVVRVGLKESGACLWVFLVHDPVAMRSMRFDVTPDGRVRRTQYDELISRGKTVMPQVERMMRGESDV